jgi:hypothetical protein
MQLFVQRTSTAKGLTHDFRHDDIDVHVRARVDKPCWDWLWICGGYGLLTDRRSDAWIAIFLVTTILTSLTGFLFPVERLLPSHIVGFTSLVALAVALLARYGRHERSWRWIYVACAVLAL